jgi:hypothetical protein
MQVPARRRRGRGFDEGGRFLVQGVVGKLRPRAGRALVGAAVFTLCIALPVSCTRQRAPAAVKPARTAAAKPAQAGSPAALQQAPPAAAAPAQPAVTPARPLPAASASGTAALLLLGSATRILPEDFLIGPLADTNGGTDDEKAALAAAAALLGSVAAGAPDGSQVTADSREAVLDLLGTAARAGGSPLAFRLGGAVVLPSGEISANVRLLRGQGSAEGELYLRREGSRWLVSDVQVNPAALAAARSRPAGRFFPSPYRWLLGGDAFGARE